jgi:hypothetical protein
MAVTYTPKIQWPDNGRRLQAKDYKIQVPTGLSDVHIREPNFVDVAAMAARSKEHAVGQGSALSIVNGLVTRDLDVTFANPDQQWKETSGSKTGPGQFQFQGGEVFLELRLALYVIQHVQPDPKDSISKQIFAEVYGHELLHVHDEVTLVEDFLPNDLKSDTDISNLLTRPYIYGSSKQTMVVAAAEFREYVRKRIAGMVWNDHWATKTNERARRRDAPEEYAKVQDRIDTLRVKQINR